MLFSDFEVYYKLLKDTIDKYDFISGVDLDVEEFVPIEQIQMLINRLKKDFGQDFIITMAPIASSLQYDSPGLGGFSYKELYESKEGKLIDWFNCQFYYDFSEESYQLVVKNGYPESKIIMGMMVCNEDMYNIIKNLTKKYNDFGGVFFWEYCNAPSNWADKMKNNIKNYFQFITNILSSFF